MINWTESIKNGGKGIVIKTGGGGCGKISKDEANKVIEKCIEKWKELGLNNKLIAYGIGLINIESGFNYNAGTLAKNSHAKGLGQFQPDTWKGAVAIVYQKDKVKYDKMNYMPDIDTQIHVLGRFIENDYDTAAKTKNKKFIGIDVRDIAYSIHHNGSICDSGLNFLNSDYVKDGKDSLKNYLHNTYDIVLKELEGNTNIVEEKSSKEPESFDQLIRVILPDLEIKEDEIREIGYVGYKFANIYKLTKDEQKLDNKKIIETAKKNSKNSPKILDIIEFNSKLHKLILKKGKYKAAISKDENGKEYNYFYNNSENKNAIYGEVKIGYGEGYSPLNFIYLPVYSPIDGIVTGIDEKEKNSIEITVIVKSENGVVEYKHVLKNIGYKIIMKGDEVKRGQKIGVMGTAENGFLNINYQVLKQEKKISDNDIIINPSDHFNMGRDTGIIMNNDTGNAILQGKYGQIDAPINCNGKIEYIDDDRNGQIVINGYKIGSNIKMVSEQVFSETEIGFDQKQKKSVEIKNGVKVGYKYDKNRNQIHIIANGYPEIIIKNFANGDNKIFLPMPIVSAGQSGTVSGDKKEENKSDNSKGSKNNLLSSIKQGVYVAEESEAMCISSPGAKIILKCAGESNSFGGDKKIMTGAENKEGSFLCSGKCNMTKKSCKVTPAGNWIQSSRTFFVKNQPALTDRSMIMCSQGGLIKIKKSSQTAFNYGSAEADILNSKYNEDIKEINENGGNLQEIEVVNLAQKDKIKVEKNEDSRELKESEMSMKINRKKSEKASFENKTYNLMYGNIHDEKGNIVCMVCMHGSDSDEKKGSIADGSFDLETENETIKIKSSGKEYLIKKYENPKDFFNNKDGIITGKEIKIENSALQVIKSSEGYEALKEEIKKETAESKGINLKVKMEITTEGAEKDYKNHGEGYVEYGRRIWGDGENQVNEYIDKKTGEKKKYYEYNAKKGKKPSQHVNSEYDWGDGNVYKDKKADGRHGDFEGDGRIEIDCSNLVNRIINQYESEQEDFEIVPYFATREMNIKNKQFLKYYEAIKREDAKKDDIILFKAHVGFVVKMAKLDEDIEFYGSQTSTGPATTTTGTNFKPIGYFRRKK